MLTRYLVAALLILALSACGGSKATPSSPPSSAAANSSGGDAILVSGATTVVEWSLPSLAQRTVVAVKNASVFDVAVSPDGKMLAYAQAPAFTPDRTDYGSDIYISDRDGKDARLVAMHSFPNELLRSPAWLDGSTTLVFQVQGLTAVNGVPDSRIDRVDVTTNQRTTFAAKGRAPAATHDGRSVTFLTYDGASLLDTLWLTDPTGSSPRAVLIGGPKLSSFGNAMPSPDASLIALGAAVPSARGRMPGEPGGLIGLASSASTTTDGLPEDVWLVTTADGSVRRLAAFGEDLPSFAWSTDGKTLYSIGGQGLWRIDVASGRKDRLGDGVFHGQVAWATH